jgi:hypothetical protein
MRTSDRGRFVCALACGLSLISGVLPVGESRDAVLAQGPAFPAGAVARYEFADTSGSVIPNRITGGGAMPTLQILGAGDYRVANGGILWNENIGDFSHT